MTVHFLPVDADARAEALEYLRAISGLGALFLVVATVCFQLLIDEPADRRQAVPVFGALTGVAAGCWVNSRLGYRFFSGTVQLIFGLVSYAVAVTALVNFIGSTTSSVPVLYILMIVVATVYTSPQAGALSLIVNLACFGALLWAESHDVMPYAPFVPEKQAWGDLNDLASGAFMGNAFIAVAAYVMSVYIARALRRRKDAAERANAELLDANERLRALDETKNRFLGVVSHDLRTPITSIKAYGELIEEEAPDDLQRYGMIIASEAGRLHRLVTDLLDLDKMEAGKMDWTLTAQDIRPVLENAAAIFTAAATDKGVTLTLDLPDAIPLVNADGDRLAQLLANLLSNAIKFTPAGGAVTLAAQHTNGQVTVSVRDTGPGIAAADIDRIFDRFSQTDTGKKEGAGTGLGLAIAKEIASAHGGNLTVESTLGEGTTFAASFPVAAAVS